MFSKGVAKDIEICALICTYNRSDLLGKVLGSVCDQTLPQEKFEVIIIDDGSVDSTKEIAMSFRDRLPLRYFHQKNSGLAAAKNHGIKLCKAPIIIFMDDDDVASPRLLEEHLSTHRNYPDENYAVLGYTDLDSKIAGKPLMHFVTEVGCYLFSYPSLKNGERLDYTYFWGGRSSCKTSFLKRYGVFNSVFRFGCEDIELGYRLSKHGLRVVYNKKAVSTMFRELSIDGFIRRLIKQGESQYVFSQLHRNPEISKWTETVDARQVWPHIEPAYDALVSSACALDKIANQKLELGFEVDKLLRDLLHRAYWRSFRASKLKGITSKWEMAG